MQLNIDSLRYILSQNVKSARLSCGLTQAELAEKADISLTFLKDIESADSATSLLNLINICHTLNITPNELLKEFFETSYSNSENLFQKINLLNEHEKEAINTLVEFYLHN